jgi:ADP-ribose pyrophosphatase YjhB (NUDIX family)
MSESREYPVRPICGVGAFVCKGDAILLIRRGKPPRFDEWSIPGGAVELGETWREAARREVREECGIEITVGDVLDAIDIIERDPDGRVRYDYAIVDFMATYLGGDLQANSDAADVRWVTRDELEQYPMNPQTREMLLRALTHRSKQK